MSGGSYQFGEFKGEEISKANEDVEDVNDDKISIKILLKHKLSNKQCSDIIS
jgi:hypothetical protein